MMQTLIFILLFAILPISTLFKTPENSALNDEVNIFSTVNDEVNISPVVNDEVNMSPAVNDAVNISPAVNDEVNISPVVNDEVNISPAVNNEGNISPVVTDEGNISPSIIYESSLSFKWTGPMSMRLKNRDGDVDDIELRPAKKIGKVQIDCLFVGYLVKDTGGSAGVVGCQQSPESSITIVSNYSSGTMFTLINQNKTTLELLDTSVISTNYEEEGEELERAKRSSYYEEDVIYDYDMDEYSFDGAESIPPNVFYEFALSYDQAFLTKMNRNTSAAEEYVIKVATLAQIYFKDPSLGTIIHFVMNNNIKYLQGKEFKVNPNSPANKSDIRDARTIITSEPLIIFTKTDELESWRGVATQRKACDPSPARPDSRARAIIKYRDQFQRAALTMAHEMGHWFANLHDGKQDERNNRNKPKIEHTNCKGQGIMTDSVIRPKKWSECSRQRLVSFFTKTGHACLKPAPACNNDDWVQDGPCSCGVGAKTNLCSSQDKKYCIPETATCKRLMQIGKDSSNVLTSPDFPSNYPDNVHTEQTVSVPDGYNIFIKFQGFALETDDSCGRDYVQICDKNKIICRQKICGTSLPDPLIFPTSSVTIVFRSDGNNSMKGYSLSYKKVRAACSENVELSEDCVCSNTVCGVSSTCVNGTTCTPACNENEKISEECMCSNELCGTTSSCINGTTCMPACTENVEISEECVCSNEVCGANHTCASGLTCAQGWEQVTDLDVQIPEFLFNCLKKEDPWISPCSEIRKYFMIFDSQGNFFQENRNQSDSSVYLSASTKKARIPLGMQIIEMEGHPKHIFQLEEVDQKKGTFYIGTNGTGSGQLLVAGNEVNPSLVLREDHCGKESFVDSIATTSPEPSVTIASITTTASTESSVTTSVITTVASTESPVTAIAISTPAPNLDYLCYQAQWRLWKVDERFLLIESVNKPGFFLNVDSVTHKVRLGMPEKLTGIYTSFISNVTLDRSAGLQAEPGIGDDAYGDVVVHYFGRDGSQHSGYICDYEWGQDSSISVCKHLGFATGMPTYNGRYSSIKNPEYAMSEVKCDSENVEECKVRTICGTSLSCLTQNSMKAFGGKGYACNSGSATDVAGVVCGDINQIENVIKEEVTCNRSSRVSDRQSVAAMFSIQKQIKTVGSSMFGNKHWSEYLLPMPMAVSLISALLLVSSQNDREVELVKPEVGEWVYLKHIYLQPNLLLLSQHVHQNFILSDVKMGVIKENTNRIHRNMIQALQNAFSSVSYDYKTVLPRNLKRIETDAATNKEITEEVCSAFNTTNQIIYELLQALKSTQGYQQNKKADTEKALDILNKTLETDKEDYEKKMVLKQKYDAAVKKSRKAYFDAAKAAMNTKCVEDKEGDGYGTAECNHCKWIEPLKKDRCKLNKTENICVEWDDPTCHEYDSECVEYGTMCIKQEITCTELKPICTGGFETICKKKDLQCEEYETICSTDNTQGIFISSPNYPSNYPNNLRQKHTLAVQDGYDILITFHDLQLETCCDYVRICDKNKLCGPKLTSTAVRNSSGYPLTIPTKTSTSIPNPITIPTSTATVEFYTDPSVKLTGYRLSYKRGEKCELMCTKKVKICNQFEKVCKKLEMKCTNEEMKCIQWDKKCMKHETICKKKNSPGSTCKENKLVCTDWVHEPAVSGSYCQDKGNQGKCTKCKWIDEVSKNMKNVADITLKMQQSVLNDETSYSGVVAVISDVVNQVETIEQDVQNYKKWEAVYQVVPLIYNEMDNGTKTMNNNSQSTNLVVDANRTIDSTLELAKLKVDLDIDLLSQMKIPIAKKSSDNALEVKGFLENLISRKIKRAADMTEEEQVSVITLLTKGKAILIEANELKAKHEVAIKKSSVGGNHKTGEQASILMENLSNRHKTEKVIESLANRMSNAIREMFKHDIEKDDINSIITKLVECSRYLTFLNEQWSDLKIFFMKLTEFLKILRIKMKEMSELYNDIGVKIPRGQLSQSKHFKEEMQRSIIDGFSNNIFVGRVAHFYAKILEGGLLKKMALIGNYLHRVDDPAIFKKMKKYIENESVKTAEYIKLEVSKEEAITSDKIMKDVLSIKNDLACNLKDADKKKEKKKDDEAVTGMLDYWEAINNNGNVEVFTQEASPDEKDEFLGEESIDLKKKYEEIENNKVGTFDCDDDNFFYC